MKKAKEMSSDELQRIHDCVEHGDLRDSQGQYEKAITAYATALKIDPWDADAWFDKGETLQKMGKLEEAQRCYQCAINLYLGS
jgi:tetratricopeptide (TPR) repeat protein